MYWGYLLFAAVAFDLDNFLTCFKLLIRFLSEVGVSKVANRVK
jgi:hypothetical protein